MTEPICECGLPMTLNPHPAAGQLSTLHHVGALYVCIPCTCEALAGWAARAQKAEASLDRIFAVAKAVRDE